MSNEGKKALVDAVIKNEEEKSRRSQKASEAGKPSQRSEHPVISTRKSEQPKSSASQQPPVAPKSNASK